MKSLLADLTSGFKQHYIWMMYGWFDVKLKYRRSFLGPFWITLSIAVMIGVMGILYSQLFNVEIKEYLPFVGTSIVIWYFITAVINEGTTVFINSSQQMTDSYLPLTTYVMRFLWRNIVIFLHNFIMVIFLVILFKLYSVKLLLFPVMLAYVSLFFLIFTIILGMICARFRDFPQIVLSITQILMFVTPVFWQKAILTKYKWITTVNPVYHILELLRSPILGTKFPFESLYIITGLFVIEILIASYFVSKYKYRVPYWVE